MKSFNKPTNELIDAALPMLSAPQHEAYFFDRLNNPNWIGPLRERRVFSSPPQKVDLGDGHYRLLQWPASKYLVRMTAHAPCEVAAVFAELQTDNPLVIGDMLHAALAMPPDLAVQILPNICRAAETGTILIHFKEASDLCLRLAENEQVDAALALAIALFTPKFSEGREEPSRYDRYWYEKGLREVAPVLAIRRPREFLSRLCDWLSDTVRAKKRVDPKSGSDFSYIWRPAIEEHSQNRDFDFAGVMAGMVREGFEQAIRSDALSLSEALALVESQSYLIFKRLRIHLINEFAEHNTELARLTIMDRTVFDDLEVKHEYAMLVGCRLNLLSERQRSEWFAWIDAEPDMSKFDANFKQKANREPTQKDRDALIRYRKFEKLHWVREHLEGDRREFYQQMLAEHGEPELADLNVWGSGGRWGHDSPMTVEQLSAESFQHAVERVSGWKPDKPHFFGPDVEGLAETFARYVGTDPQGFSSQANVLVGRPAIYVRKFIEQMAEAVKTGREIDLPAVLRLCTWALQRPIDEGTSPAYEREALVDNDWQWTRNEISRLIETACKATADREPKYSHKQFRIPMWELLKQLYVDRAGSEIVHDESKDDPRVTDYLNRGINSPRGKAIEAAFEYARWIANQVKQLDGKREVVPGGFGTMPEIREMLEWQLSPENRSIEAFSVIGAYLSTILWIDKDWLAGNAERLFSLGGIERTPPSAEGWAAWNAYLVWSRPHFDFYSMFKSQFAQAVEQSTKVQPSEQSHEQPMDHLGEHLMLFYGRGQFGLDDDGGLLRKFLTASHPDIRRHAIRFIGESLQGDERIPEEFIKRFQQLWEFYWTATGKEDAADEPRAALFGPWFASGQFPVDWALDQLEQFVAIVPMPTGDDDIVEQIAKLAAMDPERSVRILDRMVRGDREGWHVSSWEDSARQILKTAQAAAGNAKEVAVSLINFLGRRGYPNFGNLLRTG